MRIRRTVRDEASKVPAHYAMPCSTLFRIKLSVAGKCPRIGLWGDSTNLSLDILCNVLSQISLL